MWEEPFSNKGQTGSGGTAITAGPRRITLGRVGLLRRFLRKKEKVKICVDSDTSRAPPAGRLCPLLAWRIKGRAGAAEVRVTDAHMGGGQMMEAKGGRGLRHREARKSN